MSIEITPAAAEYIKIKLQERKTPDAAVRLGVRGGMCSGFAYVIEYEDGEPREKDMLFTFEDVKIIVDKKSLVFLNAIVLDCEKTMLKSGLKIRNPMETSRCGCGASFTLKS